MFEQEELLFRVSENPAEITELRLFGEKLLHVELLTSYGKKEFVCGSEKGILNHFLLKNPLADSKENEVVRFSCYCGYRAVSGVFEITLEHQEGNCKQIWSVDPALGRLDIKLNEKDLSKTTFSLEKVTKNNG